MGACGSIEVVQLPQSTEHGAISAVRTKISKNPVATTSPSVSVNDESARIASSTAVPNEIQSTSEPAYAIAADVSQYPAAVSEAAAGSVLAAATAFTAPAAALASVESVAVPKKPLMAGGLPDTVRAPIVGESVTLVEIKATVAWNFSSQLEKIYSK
jgi:hypothetical protein